MWRLFAVTLLLAVAAFSHPHVFADVTYDALFDEKGFVGVKNHWVYDEIYSISMMASADADKDGKLSSAEGEKLAHVILDPLAKSSYYNYIVANSDFLPPKGIRNLKTSMIDGRLILDFLVAVDVAATSDYNVLVIVVEDLSNYIQMTKNMDGCGADGPDGLDVEFFTDGLDGLTIFSAFRAGVEGLFVRFKK